MDQIHPMIAKVVKNYMKPTASCVLETYWLCDAQAAIPVPQPGRMTLRKAQTYATGCETVGTSSRYDQTRLSYSSIFMTFSYMCALPISNICSLLIWPGPPTLWGILFCCWAMFMPICFWLLLNIFWCLQYFENFKVYYYNLVRALLRKYADNLY